LKSGLKDAAGGSLELSVGTHTLAGGLKDYTNGVTSLSDGARQIAAGTAQLQSGSSTLSAGLTQLSTQLPSSAQIAQLTDGINSIQAGLHQVSNSLGCADTSAQTTVLADSSTVLTDLTAYKTLMTTNQSSIANLSSATTAATNADQPTLTVNTGDVAAALQVITAASNLAGHTQTLLQDVQAMNTSLTTQQQILTASVGALSSGIDTLAPNAIIALKGYGLINSATGQLSGGAITLTNGIANAHSGALSLYGGTQQLVANNGSLIQGATLVADGTTTLASKLADASSQLAIQSTSNATADHIATPISAEVTDKGNVPNYGFALSPYVLVLGLYVGALTFTVIYPVRSKFGQAKSAIGWFFSKWSVSMFVGVGQVLILSLGMIGILGLRPVDPLGFAVVLLASSFTYMAITNMLAILFDNPGRFVAMLLLVAQLGAAEGTFPILTSAPFFQAINPWLPMTYAIQGMRVAISGNVGGQTIASNTLAVLLFGIAANVILYAFLAVRHYKPFKHDSVTVDI
jgi:putative membrane protein